MSYLNHWIKRIQNKWLSEWDEQVIESLNQHTFGFAVITLNENNCEQTLWGFDEESLRITSLNYEWTLMFVFFTLQNKGAIFKTVLWFGQTCPHINLCQIGSVNHSVVLCLLGSFRQISGSEAFVFSVNTLEKCFCETCATAIRTPAKRERTRAKVWSSLHSVLPGPVWPLTSTENSTQKSASRHTGKSYLFI